MKVLGLAGGFHLGSCDAAAALLVDGRLVAHVEEERLTRHKHSFSRPALRSIRQVLSIANLKISDIDYVAFYVESYSEAEREIREHIVFNFGECPPIKLVHHHKAHAASTFFASGWDESTVITLDWSGDGVSSSIWHGNGPTLSNVKMVPRPNSLGMFYAAMTQFLGFDRGDEYKVMGLAALGNPSVNMDQILDVSGSVYQFNDQILSPQNQSLHQCVFELDSELLDKNYRRLPNEKITQQHMDLASSVQNSFEQAVINLVQLGIELCGSKRVCLAGGSGLNCSANGRLILDKIADEVYVPPFPNDSGCAYGAAAVVASEYGENISPLNDAALGPSWEDDEIEHIIRNLGCKAEFTTDLSGLIAEEIASGQTVGWFQGRMEAGPRALGMRSILADPRSPVMRDKINREIKYREDFRPFAPSVIDSEKSKYFDLPQKSPYMSFVCKVLEPDLLPAITHADQTARVQTVNEDDSPFSSLIAALGENTGVPIVLNTSFNVMGQPIVCTPRDAVAAFFSTGLNVLALGNWVLRKT